MGKHTEGPWSYEMSPDGAGFARPVVMFGTTMIAAVSRGNGAPNARLIAAAPDLLAACKEAVSRCRRCGGDGAASDGLGGPEPCGDCIQMRDAIEKAEGRHG